MSDSEQPQRRHMIPRAGERGAALLTVLLLVAVMATVSATALDRLTLATRLAGNAALAGQGRQWLNMAEQLTAVRLEDLLAADPAQTTLAGNWHGTPRTIALPDGARVTARVTDGGNCFNLNSLTTEGQGRLTVRPSAVAQFTALMSGVGIDPNLAARIAAGSADRIDSDSVALPAGAESGSPGGAMAHEAELTGVDGMTPQVAAMLRPWICALPTHHPSPLNINTLAPEQAPLLAMLAPAVLSPERARAALAQRPPGGFGGVVAFWQSPVLKDLAVPPDAASQVRVTSSFFHLQASVTGGGQTIGQSALFAAHMNRVHLVRREWTAD